MRLSILALLPVAWIPFLALSASEASSSFSSDAIRVRQFTPDNDISFFADDAVETEFEDLWEEGEGEEEEEEFAFLMEDDQGDSCDKPSILVDDDCPIVLNFFEGNRIRDGETKRVFISFDSHLTRSVTAKLNISAPGFLFSESNLVLQSNNPSKNSKTIDFTPILSSPIQLAKGQEIQAVNVAVQYQQNVEAVRDIKPPAAKTTTCIYKIEREVRRSGRGSAIGDPHFATLDGYKYDFQEAGVFKLFDSQNFAVQIFQDKCGKAPLRATSPSCVTGVALRFGTSIIRFQLQGATIAYSKAYPSTREDPSWFAVQNTKGDGNAYRVYLASDRGTWVDIVRYAIGLNVGLQVSPYFQTDDVSGLLGNWNGDAKDDVQDPTRRANENVVDLNDNLFTCDAATCDKFLESIYARDYLGRGTKSLAFLDQGYLIVSDQKIGTTPFSLSLLPLAPPTLPAKKAVLEEGQQEEADTRAETENSDGASFPTPTTSSEEIATQAARLCNAVLKNLSVCNNYIRDLPYYIQSICTADAIGTGNLDTVDSTKVMLLRACRREIDTRLASRTIMSLADRKKLVADRKLMGFGDLSACKGKCANKGVCLASGCRCKTGFSGLTCDVKLSEARN